MAAAVALFAGWILSSAGSPSERKAVSNLSFVIAASVAAVCCFLAAKRERGRLRAAWVLFAAACVLWTAGNASWAYYQLLADHQPTPSVADAFWLAVIPLVLAGMVTFPSRHQELSGRIRTLLDGLIVAGSLLLVSWAVVLGPTYRGRSQSLSAWVVALAYPIADVVIVASAISLVVRIPSGARRPPSLVAAGLISYSLSDSAYAYLAIHDRFAVGTLVDVGWVLGFLLIALGATERSSLPDTHESAGDRAALARAVLPYVLVAPAIAIAATRGDLRLDKFALGNGLVVIVLVVVRQFMTVLENVSLARQLEAKVKLRTSELHTAGRRFRSLVQHSSDVIAVVDSDAHLLYHSPSIKRVLGYDVEELEGSSLVEVVHPGDREHVMSVLGQLSSHHKASAVIECRLRQRSGAWRDVEAVATNLLDDRSVRGLVLNIRDVTERKTLEEQLRHRAFHDPLTGLANRTLFEERIEHALVRAERHQDLVVALVLDLDGFKYVNDSLGHAVGDTLLVETAGRLRVCVRPADTVARLGGDEFAVLLDRPASVADAVHVAERITDELRVPLVVDGRQIIGQASIGIASNTTGVAGAQDLIRDADVAMYMAKSRGKGRHEVFEPSMHRAVLERVEMEADLRQALDRNELVVHYQPVVSVESGRMTAVEALVRWQHPERGLVMPAEFISLAEETGLIERLGWCVLGEAARQVRVWQDRHPQDPPLALSVNLSVKQLQPTMYDAVVGALTLSGLAADSLILEVTETVLMEEADSSLAGLRQLRALGVRLAIDDFGTGYSSLGRLRRLPVEKLKIDKSFVQEIGGDGEAPIVGAIIAMAGSLGLEVVAEGVETTEQLRVLRRFGCDEVQGYLFGRPTPAADVERLLGARSPALLGAVGAEAPA